MSYASRVTCTQSLAPEGGSKCQQCRVDSFKSCADDAMNDGRSEDHGLSISTATPSSRPFELSVVLGTRSERCDHYLRVSEVSTLKPANRRTDYLVEATKAVLSLSIGRAACFMCSLSRGWHCRLRMYVLVYAKPSSLATFLLCT